MSSDLSTDSLDREQLPDSHPADQQLPPPPRSILSIIGQPVALHLAVLLGYIAVGVAVTWPHATFLTDGRLPATKDVGGYVWGFWWVAKSVLHLSDPWHSAYLAAPVGVPLGMHALMPLVGVIMMPVTLAFGPSASYNVLSIAMPGLMAYATWRVARLWLPSQAGALAAGAIFGFSPIVCFQVWLHLNLVAGWIFLPITLEAAIRLRRRSGPGQAAVLGIVLGACLLVDQEGAILALIVTGCALLPWLLPTRADGIPWRRIRLVGLAGLIALVACAPQIVAIVHADAAGSPPPYLSAGDYVQGVQLPDMFLPSPRIASFGLTFTHAINTSTFAVLPTLLALIGLILAWRNRNARLLGLLWLGAALLAVGSDIILPFGSYTPLAQNLHGQQVSGILPFTWFARLPGLSGFREPSRIAVLGVLAVALLGGYAVNWLWTHGRLRYLLVPILILGVFEAGLAAPLKAEKTMPTHLSALDGPIAADHSNSIVLDLPFGLRGGTGIMGRPFAPLSEVLATNDHHRLSVALLSRVPRSTVHAIKARPFYHGLIRVQSGHRKFTEADLLKAARNAVRMHIGWVIVWTSNVHVETYLTETGFKFEYRVDDASVWRPTGYANGTLPSRGSSTTSQ